ncbi:hypothetical protein [Ruminococcus sp.]|uniref:hypothetical protein n=1 Tax=Ruminococcus sp. TaxID=41978 RepID=UPI003F12706B
MEEMWLARDKSGDLYFHGESKPKKNKERGIWASDEINPFWINPEMFPEVKWSDSEPTKVKLEIVK